MSRIETNTTADNVVSYRTRLNRDRRWALSEGGQFFRGESEVQRTLRNVTRRLHDLSIPYAVAGGMALFQHGHRRFTEDIDILVTREGLRSIHERIEGLGYVPPFTGSKNLKDTTTGVRIEFLIAGQFPGDGKPKPVAFPDPNEVFVEFDGVRYVNLPTLIELKLASGMTNPGRIKDLADVQELIKAVKLPRDFNDQLNPFVRERFIELWEAASSDSGHE